MGAALAAAVVLGSTGCTDAATTPAADPSATTSAEPTALSGPGTGHVLVQGTLHGVDPASGPAGVQVQLWPQEDHSPVGEKVDPWPSRPVTVDDSGHWRAEVDPAQVPSTFLGGTPPFVNFDVLVHAGQAGTSWSTTAWLTGDGDVWRSEGATAADRVIDVSMDLAAGTVTLTDSLGEATTSPLDTFGPPSD